MRAVVSLVARYRSPTTFEYANESCSDVSVGGMFINSAAPAPTGTLLKLECDTDAGNAESKIRGVARVVWLRREPSEHGPAGMGVKFVKLEAGSRELIEEIVARLAEAGVQARSVSAAPEQRMAAGGGASTSFVPEISAPSPVKLVPSSSPPAADGGQGPQRGEPAAAKQAAHAASAATESWASAAADDLQPRAAADSSLANEGAETDDGRASLGATGSSRPPAPKPSRFGWKLWLGVIVVVLIAIAIADRRGLGPEKTAVTPETPSIPAAAPSSAPQPSAASPTPTPQPSEPARPKLEPKPEPAAAAPQPQAAEPAPSADAKPAAAAAAPEPSPASATAPLYTSIAGQPDYVVDFVSQPNGATVTIDEKATLVTPATVNFGAMPDRVKVTAKKPGFRSSSIWMKRDGFELKAGVLKRRAYITLREEPAAPGQ